MMKDRSIRRLSLYKVGKGLTLICDLLKFLEMEESDMKKKTVLVFLMLMSLCLAFPLMTFAEETTNAEGIPLVQMNIENKEIKEGEVSKVTLSLSNLTATVLKDVQMNVNLPEGLSLVSGKTKISYDTVHPGESQVHTFEVRSTPGKTGALVPSPGTGIPGGNILSALVLPTVILLVAIGLILWRKKRKTSFNRMLCFVVCMALSLELFSLVLAPTVRAEGTGQSWCETTEVISAGEKVNLTADITVGATEDLEIENTILESESAVPVGSDRCEFLINVKNGNLNEDFDTLDKTTDITLIGALENMSVEKIEKQSESSFIMTLSGGLVKEEGLGMIEMNTRGFSGTYPSATCAIRTVEVNPWFDVESSTVESGKLTLPFSIDCASFTDEFTKVIEDPVFLNQNFAFIDGEGEVVEGINFVKFTPNAASATDAALTITVDGITESGALYNTIDECSLRVNNDVTNCKDFNIYFDASDAIVRITTVLKDYSVASDEITLTAHYSSTINVLGGDVVGLMTEDIEFISDWGEDLTWSLDGVSGNQFDYTMTLKMAEPSDGTPEDEQIMRTFAETLPTWVEVKIKNDRLVNAEGIPIIQEEDQSFIIQPAESTVVMNDETILRKAPGRSDTALKDFKKAYNHTKTLISAVKNISSGNVIGFIGDILGFDSGDNAVKMALEELKAQNVELQSQVTDLSYQIANLEKNLDASENLKRFYDSNINMYNVIDAVNNTQNGNLLLKLAEEEAKIPEGTTYAEAGDYRSCVESIIKVIDGRSSGSKFNGFLDQTLVLGDMITGSHGVFPHSIFEDYDTLIEQRYNWDPETFNAKQAFRASALSRYLDAYTLCQIYINEEVTDNPSAINNYYDALDKLQVQLEKIKEMVESKDFNAKTSPRADGKILNLVTKEAYSPTAFSTFSMPTYYGNTASLYYSKDLTDTFDCDLSVFQYKPNNPNATLNVMLGRYEHAGYNNLLEELNGVGFKAESQYLYMGKPYVVCGHPDNNLFKWWRDYYANVFNLAEADPNKAYVQDMHVGDMRKTYWAFKGWKFYQNDFNLLRFNPKV